MFHPKRFPTKSRPLGPERGIAQAGARGYYGGKAKTVPRQTISILKMSKIIVNIKTLDKFRLRPQKGIVNSQNTIIAYDCVRSFGANTATTRIYLKFQRTGNDSMTQKSKIL